MEVRLNELYEIFQQHPGVSTDTRSIAPQSIFFALKGASFNGNKFAGEALEKGAAYAVVDEAEYANDDRCILVQDVLTTLQQLANKHRKTLGTRLVAITGSNGKTTTKELVYAVLSESFNVLATGGNFNNHIGVPLTLLRLTKAHDIGIIEMGASGRGEIKMLCEIAEPDSGMITNIGHAHIEGFGSYEAIIETKTEMYDFLRNHGGKVFVHEQDELLMSHAAGMDQVTYGGSEARCKGELLASDPYLEVRWQFDSAEVQEVTTSIYGKYNFPNIMAAVCIGNHFGMRPEAINRGVAGYVSENNRSQVIEGRNTIYLDAYNANPSSMKVALEAFDGVESEDKWVILGDMLELGDLSQSSHTEIVDLVLAKGFENALFVGDCFGEVTAKHGFQFFADRSAAAKWLNEHTPEGCQILIKGSRGIGLEQLAEQLR